MGDDNKILFPSLKLIYIIVIPKEAAIKFFNTIKVYFSEVLKKILLRCYQIMKSNDYTDLSFFAPSKRLFNFE